ncbi:MAG: hypothetical protein LCH66_10900 [Actinobacteria bacterium]|nr:hypothetical protein [Actinomycetota bacterium]
MPRSPREVVRSAVPLVTSTALGRAAVGVGEGLRRRPRVDPAGWSAPELTAYLDAPRASLVPPRRAGHEAVRLVHELDGTLPVEAVLLARAVADAAPPSGHELSPTLGQILQRYLPDTLVAYRNSGSAAQSAEGHRLIVEQLRLLHQVTRDVARAEAEHDDRELRLQQAFLSERFDRPSNGLDLTPAVRRPVAPSAAGTPVPPMQPRGLASSAQSTHHRLGVEVRPTAVFTPDPDTQGILRGRLALPSGLAVTLGAVYEKHSGAVEFVTATSKRWQAKRRQRGFGAAQLDVAVHLPLREIRRFVIHATARPAPRPADIVLFLTEGASNTAELPTTLVRRPGASTTVIASGHDTSDGLFVRNESTVFGSLRAACEGFDYRGVTWLSADTPAV